MQTWARDKNGYADGIGYTGQDERLSMEASSGCLEEDIDHTFGDSLKLLENLAAILNTCRAKYLNSNKTTFSRLKVFGIQCVKTTVTLVSVSAPDDGKFYTVHHAHPKSRLHLMHDIICFHYLNYWHICWYVQPLKSFVDISGYHMDPPTWLIQTLENEPALNQPSIFQATVFSKQNPQQYPPATAIINRVDNSDGGIIHAINHLTKYPFFKEIFIYNQVKSRPLKVEQLYHNKTSDYDQVSIQVIEANDSIYGMGKFAACAVASYGKCYFQDDLWLNPYLDSLYTHSFRYPDHLIANTRPVNYVDYMTWRFSNKEISLHTGYTDLRYGAFISQQKVQNFLSQSSMQGLSASKLRLAEFYFSIWLNQYPYLVSNPLLSSGRDGFKNVDTVNNRALVEQCMYDAVSILENTLINTSSMEERSDYFEKGEIGPPTGERDVSMPVPDAENDILFSSKSIANISQFESIYNQTHGRNSLLRKPSFAYHTYHNAVDQDIETCWKTPRAPLTDDYFGLYLVGDIQAKRITMYTPTKFDIPLNQVFKVETQHILFGSWEECEIKSESINQLNYRIGFDFECTAKEALKSIRIRFKQDLQSSFELCSLGLDNFVV
ncbi:hypothetical protein [Parasitella parasitica]|uniref:Uncharacterized protein n=1 Tax=Parasitella parasitica TaxID=35722 RepID=A0A0B7N6Y9_9FUNG|nr:hypothetical protein [Parasitella parasitica]